MFPLSPLPLNDLSSLDTREVWAALTEVHWQVAELKGLCESLPNQGTLLNNLFRYPYTKIDFVERPSI